jgi:hypothetical protein
MKLAHCALSRVWLSRIVAESLVRRVTPSAANDSMAEPLGTKFFDNWA